MRHVFVARYTLCIKLVDGKERKERFFVFHSVPTLFFLLWSGNDDDDDSRFEGRKSFCFFSLSLSVEAHITIIIKIPENISLIFVGFLFVDAQYQLQDTLMMSNWQSSLTVRLITLLCWLEPPPCKCRRRAIRHSFAPREWMSWNCALSVFMADVKTPSCPSPLLFCVRQRICAALLLDGSFYWGFFPFFLSSSSSSCSSCNPQSQLLRTDATTKTNVFSTEFDCLWIRWVAGVDSSRSGDDDEKWKIRYVIHEKH